MLTELIGWIAPIATMIAAMMTAANLGARLTGSGFIVFTVGSICWMAIGISTGQTNLLATNAFLTVVNLVGIWRWLGRQRAYEDGGRSAEAASRRSAAPNLFTATGVAGRTVVDSEGNAIGKAVEALVECGSLRISYVVVGSGSGLGEQLRPVPCEALRFDSERLILKVPRAVFDALEPLDTGDWPALAPALNA